MKDKLGNTVLAMSRLIEELDRAQIREKCPLPYQNKFQFCSLIRSGINEIAGAPFHDSLITIFERYEQRGHS